MVSDDGGRSWTERWEINQLGAGLVLSGFVLEILAFTVLDWFHGKIQLGDATFGGVHRFVEGFHRQLEAANITQFFSFGLARPYFSWLGPVLLAGALVTGALAVSGFGRRYRSLRWIAAIVCAGAIALTVLALDLVRPTGTGANKANLPGYSTYVANCAAGAWAAIVGFALIFAGSVFPHPRAESLAISEP